MLACQPIDGTTSMTYSSMQTFCKLKTANVYVVTKAGGTKYWTPSHFAFIIKEFTLGIHIIILFRSIKIIILGSYLPMIILRMVLSNS